MGTVANPNISAMGEDEEMTDLSLPRRRKHRQSDGGGGEIEDLDANEIDGDVSIEKVFEGKRVPTWREQLTFRVFVMSFFLSVMFCVIVMKLNLTTAIIPSLNVSARLLGFFFVKELVQGVIEGETRVLAASMTMEQIFKGTKEFKKEVFEKVQLELNQFGLLIYNANVKQLVDVRGHEYFSYLGQKTQMEAANQAKVDVAEARMKGEVGSKQRDGETLNNAANIDTKTKIFSTQKHGEGRQQEAKVKAEVKIYENEREVEVAEANAKLAMKKAEWVKQTQVAEVVTAKAVAVREAELQLEVEKKNAMRQTEKLKAEFLSQATVDYKKKKKKKKKKAEQRTLKIGVRNLESHPD